MAYLEHPGQGQHQAPGRMDQVDSCDVESECQSSTEREDGDADVGQIVIRRAAFHQGLQKSDHDET